MALDEQKVLLSDEDMVQLRQLKAARSAGESYEMQLGRSRGHSGGYA